MTMFQKQERCTINSPFRTLASHVTRAPSCQVIVKIANKQRMVMDKKPGSPSYSVGSDVDWDIKRHRDRFLRSTVRFVREDSLMKIFLRPLFLVC